MAVCCYDIQLAFNLHVHSKYHDLLPQAPILFLAGGVGLPTDPSVDSFLWWCSTRWQRVYICAGPLENSSPLYFMSVCRKHANVCVVDEGTSDTYFESLCVTRGWNTTPVTSTPNTLEATTNVGMSHGCLHVNSPFEERDITHPGVYQLRVQPSQCPYTIEKGWAKLTARPRYHSPGHSGSCRTCGYADHRPWDCPVSKRNDYKFAG